MRMTTRYFTCFAFSVLAFAQAQTVWSDIDGHVIDESGAGIADALIVASGAGFNGWASTDKNGSFHLKAAGHFISVRHARWKAVLLRTADLAQPVRITLVRAGESAQKMPACNVSGGAGKTWIGQGLKVDAGRYHFKGPVYGEHDSHWYLKIGNDSLHLVDGYAWHAGLPLEERLNSSENISVASWESGDIVGLDISAQTKDGKRWRWLGAPIASAIEYENAGADSADAFDRIMQSACYGSAITRN